MLRTELVAIASAAWTALRTNGRSIVWPVLIAGICTVISFTLVAIPVAIWLLGMCVQRLALGPDTREGSRFEIGLLAACGLLPFLGSLAIGEIFVASFPRGDEGAPDQIAFRYAMALLWASCVLGSAAFAPFQSAATHAARGSSFADAIGSSLTLAARRPLATAFIGALQGVALALPTVGGAVTALGSWASWISYLSLAHALATPSRGTPRPLVVLAIPFVLALLGTSLVAVSIEPRMWELFSVAELRPLSDTEHPLDIWHGGIWSPSRDTASPHFVRDAFELEHEIGLETLAGVRGVRRDTFQDAEGNPVYCPRVGGAHTCRGMIADRAGHRLHDGPLDRIVARIGALSAGTLVVALLALALAVVRARRATRGLASPSPHATKVTVRDGNLESREGDYIGLFDERTPRLGAASDEDHPPEKLWLVTPQKLTRLGPRDGASSIPEGSWLAPADDSPEAALSAHVAHAIAIPAFVAALATLFAGAIMLVWL